MNGGPDIRTHTHQSQGVVGLLGLCMCMSRVTHQTCREVEGGKGLEEDLTWGGEHIVQYTDDI